MTTGNLNSGCRRTRRSREAFTLLELLLVLGIIVLMAGLAWPALRSSMAKSRLRDSAQLLRVELARARLTAMENGTPLEFRYRAGEGRFRIASRTVAADVADGAPALGRGERSSPQRKNSAPRSGGELVDEDSEITESQLPEGVIFAEPQRSRPGLEPADEEGFDVDAEDESLQSEGWSPAIVFLPDGTASNATLALRNGQGAQVVVQLRGMTGLAKPGEIESCDDTENSTDAPEPPLETARESHDALVR